MNAEQTLTMEFRRDEHRCKNRFRPLGTYVQEKIV